MTPEVLELIRSIKALRDSLEACPTDYVIANLLALEIDKLANMVDNESIAA
jgi:hypothetical protein